MRNIKNLILFCIILIFTYGCNGIDFRPASDSDLMQDAELSADSKITALPELTATPADNDLIYIVTGVDTTPVSQSISISNLLSGNLSLVSLTASGAITGTSLDAGSGAITGGSLNVGTGAITSGDITSSGTISAAGMDIDPSTDPTLELQNSTAAASTAGIFANSTGVYPITMSIGVEDDDGENSPYFDINGSTKTIDFLHDITLQPGNIVAAYLAADSITNDKVADDAIGISELSATGTASNTTFLRGDNTWGTLTGSGDIVKVGTPVDNQIGVWTGDGTLEGDTDLTFDGTTLYSTNFYSDGLVDIGSATIIMPEGWVDTDALADSSVTTDKIAAGASVDTVILDDSTSVEIMADADGMADNNYNGITITGRAAGEALTQWDLVRLANDADPWHQADANAAGEFPAIGIVVATTSDTVEAKVLVTGVVRNEGWTGLTPGGKVYLSTTAGGLTQTKPSTSGDCIQIVGFALSDSEILFDFSRAYAEVE